jgi:TonB family protein
MTARWNERAPRALKQAYALTNGVEVLTILAIMVAIKLGTRTDRVSLPPVPGDSLPIIVLKPGDFRIPPPIDFSRPTGEVVLPSEPVVTTVPLPVPDPLATDLTMASQNQLGALSPVDPRLKLDNANARFVLDTNPVQPRPDTLSAMIPAPGAFVPTRKKPEMVRVPAPVYPEHCRVLGITGKATVQMLLDLDGSVMEARIMQSSDNAELDSAAVAAGRKSKFTPAIGGGNRPVHVWVAVPFVFQLDR